MSKTNLIDTIQEYKNTVRENKELETVEELLDRIRNDTDFFIRKKISGKVDVAASVLLLSEDREKGLFLFHKKIKKWTMPGGHADGETDLYKVALAELKEEVGVTLTHTSTAMPSFIYKFDYTHDVFGYKKSIINLFYIEICPAEQTPQIMEPDKCDELRWFSLNDIKKITEQEGYQCISQLVKTWERSVE